MKNKEYNLKAINDTYKNAHIAMQSIKDILPAVKNTPLKNEIKKQYCGYKDIINEISSFMKEEKIEPKDINIFQKTFMLLAIKSKTLMNKSKNHIADMLIKGTTMGIIELTAMKNEEKNLNEKVLSFVEKLLTAEESFNERLKNYL